MIFLLSPAKTLDYETEYLSLNTSEPEQLKHSAELIKTLKELSAADIGELMSLSDKLADLNHER